jgi:ribosome-binding ATPase YchF (GTP1/OBG family)
MKDVGLVGASGSGKSTLFTALTHSGGSAGRGAQAVVPVPDPRLEVLAGLEASRDVVPARVRFIDLPGTLTAQGLATLRETDVLCVVVRAFGPDPNPATELSEMTGELLLADLALVENALEGARRSVKGQRQGEGVARVDALTRAQATLSDGGALRDLELGKEDLDALRGLGLLSLKPWVVVANLEEGAGILPDLPEGTVGVWAEIEAEAAAIPSDEAAALLRAFGVAEPGLDKVVAACYRALDLVTFLTFNEREARAWEVRRGATAPEAAAVIHTDLQRGFIRAEVVGFEDLVASGGWDAARARGAVRVEGKDYLVREGDVVHVRFAI